MRLFSLIEYNKYINIKGLSLWFRSDIWKLALKLNELWEHPGEFSKKRKKKTAELRDWETNVIEPITVNAVRPKIYIGYWPVVQWFRLCYYISWHFPTEQEHLCPSR